MSALGTGTGCLCTHSLSFLASLKHYSVHHLEFWQTIIFYYLGKVVLSYHGEEVTWPKLMVYGNEHSVHSSVHPGRGGGGHGISHRSYDMKWPAHDREPDFRPQL